MSYHSHFATREVEKYDGQSICVGGRVAYELGHYLGNGASGSVYQATQLCEHNSNDRPVAVKVVHPIGFKLALHGQVQKSSVLVKGQSLTSEQQKGKQPLTQANVWWLLLPHQPGAGRQLVAAYEDAGRGQLREMPLPKCVEVWGWQPLGEQQMQQHQQEHQHQLPDPNGKTDASRVGGDANDLCLPSPPNSSSWATMSAAEEERLNFAAGGTVRVNATTLRLPLVPPKYLKWLRARAGVCREIMHMRRVGSHPNVVRLHDVLELLQDTKATLFLVLELVLGGELIERMRAISSGDLARAQQRIHQLLQRERCDSIDEVEAEIEQEHAEEELEPAKCAVNGNDDGVSHGGDNQAVVHHIRREQEPEEQHSERALGTVSGGTDAGHTSYYGLAIETFARKYFRQLLSGVAFIHARGVCHRDLKPENLLLSDCSDDAVLKIADFGLSAVFSESLSMDCESEASLQLSNEDSLNSCCPSPQDPVGLQSQKQQRQQEQQRQQNDTCPDTEFASPARPSLTRLRSVVGSPHYVAPEIVMAQCSPPVSPERVADAAQGSRPAAPRTSICGDGGSPNGGMGRSENVRSGRSVAGYDGRAVDMWSAGVVLYSLLFGALPFGPDLASCPRFRRYAEEQQHQQGAAAAADCEQEGLSWFFPCHHSPAEANTRCGPGLAPSITRPACDLILMLLRLEPNQRLSADDALLFLEQRWLAPSTAARTSQATELVTSAPAPDYGADKSSGKGHDSGSSDQFPLASDVNSTSMSTRSCTNTPPLHNLIQPTVGGSYNASTLEEKEEEHITNIRLVPGRIDENGRHEDDDNARHEEEHDQDVSTLCYTDVSGETDDDGDDVGDDFDDASDDENDAVCWSRGGGVGDVNGGSSSGPGQGPDLEKGDTSRASAANLPGRLPC